MCAERRALSRQLALVQVVHVRQIVADPSCLEPLVEALQEELVFEIETPDRRELAACLGERTVQVQQTDESRPLTRPVGHGKNRSLVTAQSRQNMMAVLPGGGGKHQLRVGMDLHENVHALALRGNESVLFRLVIRVGAHQLEALLRERGRELPFHVTLRRPALLVGRLPQIAAGNQ